MKKLAMLALAVMLSCGSWVALNATTSEKTAVEMTAGYSITVYHMTGESGAKIKRQGVYDPDNETLTVGKQTYRVTRNRRYGDGSRYSDYVYRAGDFYFNL